MSLMFLFCFSLNRTPEQCPSVVSLLAESYNPHVRYGAAMALGIACAGTGLKVKLSTISFSFHSNYLRKGEGQMIGYICFF